MQRSSTRPSSLVCRRRGPAVDLVLDRPRQARSQFVFTQAKGREAIFWQTQKTARAANPGGRIPRRRTLAEPLTITVDTRERYPYRFTHQGAHTVRATVTAGDYAIHTPDGRPLRRRRTQEPRQPRRHPLRPRASPSSRNGRPSSRSPRSSELPLAAIVVEARDRALFKLEHVNGTRLADQHARLQVRYPHAPIVFADTRPHAEHWTHRFLTTALTDTADPS